MRKIIIFMIALMTVLGACTQNTDGNPSGSGGSSFVGGSDAVEVEFADSVPDEIYDQGRGGFPITLTLENKGEFEIPANSLNVALKGIDQQSWNLESNTKTLGTVLRSVTSDGTVIGRAQVTYSNVRYTGSIGGGKLPFNINAHVCYPYQTVTVSTLCYDEDIYSVNDDRTVVCEAESDRDVENSGAPVSIDNFNQYPSGEDAIIFSFDITHNPLSENSIVYLPNSLDNQCDAGDDSFTVRDSVRFTVKTDVAGTDCGYGEGASGNVRLDDSSRSARITCTQPTSGLDDVVKPLSVTLDYHYFDVEETSITVKADN